MTTIKLRLKESKSLLRAAEKAHKNNNLDLLYLIEEKLGRIWVSDFKEYHGKTWCEVSNQPDVVEIYESVERVQTLTANLEAHKRLIGQFGLDL